MLQISRVDCINKFAMSSSFNELELSLGFIAFLLTTIQLL